MKKLYFLLTICSLSLQSYSQKDSAKLLVDQLPEKYLEQVSSKAARLEQKLDKTSAKVLDQFAKQEAKIKKRLAKIDSVTANKIFGDVQEKYGHLEQKLEQHQKLAQYMPYLDTLKTSLKFLTQNQQLLGNAKDVQLKLANTLNKINGMESQLDRAEEIKRFLKARKEFLKAQLEKFGFAKQIKKLNKQAYYYSANVSEYKQALKDPKKLERKAIELLSKTKKFQDFMHKNSQFASLFGLRNPDDMSNAVSFTGLQTRASVTEMLQGRVGSGTDVQALFMQNIPTAQTPLSQLKNKVAKYTNGSLGNTTTDKDMPDFRPNSQKTKSFLKRLEYGGNVQSQKARHYFPVTSDIGLSLGYKLNDKSVIGVGASYKLGLGSGWRNIRLSNEGVGIRSFIDYKFKGSLFLSGGYEQNYRTLFTTIEQLRNYSAWQNSGLIGLSKKYSVGKKLNGSMQLLWDFLSYQQVPRTQPVLFRVGYGLK